MYTLHVLYLELQLNFSKKTSTWNLMSEITSYGISQCKTYNVYKTGLMPNRMRQGKLSYISQTETIRMNRVRVFAYDSLNNENPLYRLIYTSSNELF